MSRFEYFLGVASTLLWVVALLSQLRPAFLAGLVGLSLYQLYSIAAFLGWIAGNVYVTRLRAPGAQRFRRRLLLIYLVGPPSLVYLLRAAAPLEAQAAAPLVPLYAFVVYGIFFMVPVSFRGMQRPPRRPKIGR